MNDNGSVRPVLAILLVLTVNIGGGLWSFLGHSPFAGWTMFQSERKAMLHVVRLSPGGTPVPVTLTPTTQLFEPMWMNPYYDDRGLRPIVISLVRHLKSKTPGRYRATLTYTENLRPAVTWTYEE